MKLILKRIGAYFIDITLVSLVATLLTSNVYINKDYQKYSETYNKYNEEYETYDTYYSDLEEYYNDKKINKEEYNNLLEYDKSYTKELKKYYNDKKISKTEYEEMLESLNNKYSKKELDYSYKLLKYSIIPTIVSLMCILLYFVAIQHLFSGKTLGKFIMKLKVVSNDGGKLSIVNYFIRSLIVNEVFINILNIIFLLVLSKNNYFVYNKIIYVITYILEMVIMFTIVFDKNNRGLHDYISNTKVIEDKKE